jgi:elongation factor Ts
MVSTNQLKQLRKETGVSMIDCKKALEESENNIDQAKEILRKWGKDFASSKKGRETNQGIIESYIHPNKKVGVLVQLCCETDFVAKSEEFQKLAHELCLQIAAMSPLYLKHEDIPEEFLEREKSIYQEQLKDSGKSKEIIGQIIEGKIDKYKKQVSLLSQPWVKDNSKAIEEIIKGYISKLGENIVIKKFVRFEI